MDKYHSISEISDLSGVTTRTIRFYDQIGLLKPTKISPNGYRRYDQANIDTLEQILYFKNLGFSLDQIKVIISDPGYDVVASLASQEQLVEKEIAAKQELLASLKQAIKSYRGEITMENSSKFKVFKEGQQYEQEATDLYGQDKVSVVKESIGKMSDADAENISALEQDMFAKLDQIKSQGLDVRDDLAQEVFQEHQAYLKALNPNYSKQYHAQLAKLYEADDRFQQYYNNHTQTKAADVLIEIIQEYTK
ncbi:MerR family transcriptional regulator [Leuconostocaceae bacterium ESL0723]|nr:MerR family transcriptional regulator [Leuconostocaceae bacterium ESL0723]